MNIEKIRENLKPLDLDKPYIPSVEEEAYFDFYSINFSSTLANIQHYFGVIDCAGHAIACHYFSNEHAQRTCFIVHGYLDHSGLYKKIIDYLLHRGCNVVVFDLPGHGLSSGERVSIDSFGDYVLVLRHCLEFFYKKIPSPWHVVAQSTGGAIVMDYLLKQQVDEETGPFEKVLLLAPLVRVFNWHFIKWSYKLTGFFMGNVKRTFKVNSHDQAFSLFLEEVDPLQEKRIPVKWIKAMLDWEKQFNRLSWSDLEVLVVQGQGDKVVDWRHNLTVIRNKFPRAKVMKIKDARHHLACESDQYFERVVQAADIYFDRRRNPRDK